MSKFKAISFIFTCFITFTCYTQDSEKFLQKNIRIVPGNYSLKEILEKLTKDYNIKLSYNSNDLPIDDKLTLQSNTYNLKGILDLISSQLPIDYILVNQYVILKKRALKNNYLLHGRIIDGATGKEIIGAMVTVQESNLGCISDNSGYFSFLLSPGKYTLQVQFIGFESIREQISIYGNKFLSFNLSPNVTEIDEVLIIAQKEYIDDLSTGRSIQSINSEEITTENNNLTDVLHAKFSGIWVTKTSGAPGDNMRVRIRGLNSIFANNDPLYVVDGIALPNVNFKSLGVSYVNIHDIKDIHILKDASSTAMYGFMGGNGVVLINTKKGLPENHVFFSSKVGFQRFANRYELLNTKDFLTLMNSSKTINTINIRKYYPVYSDTLRNVDWQDEIFQDGFVSEYQLSAGGTIHKLNYYFSGNIFNHQGIIQNTQFKKINFHGKLGRNIGKRVYVNLGYNLNQQHNLNNIEEYLGNYLPFAGINKAPCLQSIPESRMYRPTGSPPILAHYSLNSTITDIENTLSPTDYIEYYQRELTDNQHSINFSLIYNVMKNININLASSYFKSNQVFNIKQGGATRDNQEFDYILTNENYKVLNNQGTITFRKDKGANTFSVIGSVKSNIENIYWELDSINYIPNESDITTSYEQRKDLLKGSLLAYSPNGKLIRIMNSVVGNINYSYKNRYNVSAILNYSNLKEGNNETLREYFPSFAISWNVANENWFGVSLINGLSIYANYGKSASYPFNDLANTYYDSREPDIYSVIVLHPQIQVANHYLTSEKVYESNYGLKLSMFESRLSFESVYFHKTNSGLIVNREIPVIFGGGYTYQNIGTLVNDGVELNLEIIPVQTKKITLCLGGNVSFNKQKVKSLKDQDTLYFDGKDILFPDFIIIKKHELGDIYGYKYLGKYTHEDQEKGLSQYSEVDGGKYLNADTIRNPGFGTEDKVVIGNSIPNLSWNFYTSVQYKKFEVEMLWYAVLGVQKYNATKAASYISGTNTELGAFIYDSMQVYNSNTIYESSYFIEDASFIRLKSLTFIYTPQKSLWGKIKPQFSLQFENLLTITNYTGYDPETSIYTDNSFSDNSVDRGAFPIPKAIYATIGLTF